MKLKLTRFSKDGLVGLLIFFGALTIYLNSSAVQVSDSKYTLLLSEEIIDHGTFRLDNHFWGTQFAADNNSVQPIINRSKHIKKRNDHLYYSYPYGTSILSVPFVLSYRALGKSVVDSNGHWSKAAEKRLQKIIAAILMSIACVIFYTISRNLLSRKSSLIVTIIAGLGTQVWSTASRGLWSHTWGVVILSLVCYLLLRAEKDRKLQPILLATLLAWGYFVRPTAALYILPFTVLVWVDFRSHFKAFIFAGTFWLGLFLLYSYIEHGQLPHYYMRASNNIWSVSTFFVGLYGQLLSPSRGLLIYVPSILIVGYLLVKHYTTLAFKNLVIASILSLVLHTIVMASQWNWWAGVSYGARFYTDVVPIFVLLGIIGVSTTSSYNHPPNSQLNTMGKTVKEKILLICGVTCVVAGIFINGIGALSPKSSSWSEIPYRMTYKPVMTLSSWANPPFLCPFSSNNNCLPHSDDQMLEEFQQVDRNNDSFVDQKEFRRNRFRNFDDLNRNHDSMISREEWRRIYSR